MASSEQLKKIEESLKKLLQRETPEMFNKWLINKRNKKNKI